MKLSDLLSEGGSGSGRPNEGTRSKKNLWFKRQDLWLDDIQELYGLDIEMITTNSTEDGDMFAVDEKHDKCYGVWRKQFNQGIVFIRPRPLSIVQHNREKLIRVADAPLPNQ